MFSQNLRKIPDRVTKKTVNSKAPFVTRTSNHGHRKALIVTTCIILVVILCTINRNSGSHRNTAYANSVRGIGVGIYWDQECTNRTLSLDWGLIEPGSNSTVRVYVRNEAESEVSLWLATSNWTPLAALSHMTLTWTYPGRILSADEVVPIKLILDVSPIISGITDFRFDIVVTTTS
jgi:hypothetical protein